MSDLNQKKKNRFLFLKSLYDTSNGSTDAVFDMHEVGSELLFDSEETSKIVDYLINESLIHPFGLGGTIQLTHWGLKEVEEAMENPSEPTSHFLPINIVNIGSMTNSTLQQATHNSSITVTIDQGKLNDLSNILASLKSIQNTLDTSIDLHKELISEIETIASQEKSPKPKSVIITESLKTIKSILEKITVNAATPAVIDQITHFLTNHIK